ncbi:MAG: TIGR00282 family metallophosphoesterase [Planctomycetes bacterium]|nr:TIGR00282 family metallophosphoesterase [Planctomycetota bacterium]
MPADDAPFRALILGDVVGRPGREAVLKLVPGLRREHAVDLVIANVENAASGSGITPGLFRSLARAGIDLMTLGDHSWKRKENLEVLQREPRALRPHNYPPEALGTGATVLEGISGEKVGFVTVLGRIFMEPVDCPFRTIDRALAEFPADVRIRIVEVHAEATSEKISIGWYLDGRVTCVFGTHTHVPTADERVLPKGTAYISDLGMTGPYDGVIGRTIEPVLHKFITSMHATFTVAEGNARLCGILVDIDRKGGKAIALRRVDIPAGGRDNPSAGPPLPPIQEAAGGVPEAPPASETEG